LPEAENHVLPGPTYDSWRTWLMTGVRRTPADHRRMRGEHTGLKRMLLEGMPDREDRPHAWRDFSGAMIRHAVDEAMRTLPLQDTQVVKLAYFGGFSNREIAEQVGLTETVVQRRLRRALSAISEYVQQGRALGRRAVFAVMLGLSGRWLHDGAHYFVRAAAVAGVAAIIVAQPAPSPAKPSMPIPVGTSAVQPHAQPAQARPVVPPLPSPVIPALPSPPTRAVQLPIHSPSLPPIPPLPSPPVKLPQI
jgi:RNA polymerase sigma factor (sigma-70 family)